MKHNIRLIVSLLVLTISLSASAAYNEESTDYSTYATLKGLKTIAVNVDPPRGEEYKKMTLDGVSTEQLQEKISTRLRDAGFKVISVSESLSDPEAVLLDLRVRVDFPWSAFYAYDLQLSINQKFPLPQSENSYYSVRTWSDRQVGAIQLVGPGLNYLYDYSMQLVENFIKAHQAQN